MFKRWSLLCHSCPVFWQTGCDAAGRWGASLTLSSAMCCQSQADTPKNACSKKYQLDYATHTCKDTQGLINEFLIHLFNCVILQYKKKNLTLAIVHLLTPYVVCRLVPSHCCALSRFFLKALLTESFTQPRLVFFYYVVIIFWSSHLKYKDMGVWYVKEKQNMFSIHLI